MVVSPLPQVSARAGGTRVRLAVALAYVALVAAVAWHVVVTVQDPAMRWTMADLQVYREAVMAGAAGRPVYAAGFTAYHLPFLYPPFALLVLAPLAVLPLDAAKAAMTLLSSGALAMSCRLAWRHTPLPRAWRHPLAVASVGIILVSEPMQQNLVMGQVNVLLALAVLTDVLLPRDHPAKGVLVGLAAGIKLTPALVAVYYLLRGDRRAAGAAAGAFAATVLAGAVAHPSASASFWLGALAGDRIGAGHLGNQSLRGVLLRLGTALGWPASLTTSLWLALAGLVGVGGLLLIVRRDPGPLATYGALALVTLLISPLSWTPHWIALAPAVAWLAGRRGSPRRAAAVLAGTGLVLFAWPVGGVWSGLVWTVYPAGFWPGVPRPLRLLGAVVLGNLYPILAATSAGTAIAFRPTTR
nr:glycosyltransferase 87 family protein [Propionicimonas sp.]